MYVFFNFQFFFSDHSIILFLIQSSLSEISLEIFLVVKSRGERNAFVKTCLFLLLIILMYLCVGIFFMVLKLSILVASLFLS